ncbi:conserved hypothetical protein [Saccharophagus degradans 2-40]|uniref:Uncharacterized protein n=2 Tax=Saccharophagus degradans TaxID=86304 RepID=Q21L44_SACD2|nr:conserved hypothetical protein [Saccharophagus degradans 2-40]
MIKPFKGRLMPVSFLFVSSLLVSATVFSASANADVKANIGFEQRNFISDALLAEQTDSSSSLTGLIEAYRDFDNNAQRLVFSASGRVDENDSERNHIDLAELYWWRQFEQFELYTGVRKVTWGVTESVHLVDVINQTNALENIDGEDKLGQPMIELIAVRDWGTVEAYVLPYFRERQTPGLSSRLRPPLPVLEMALYESERKQNHVDFAMRWSHYLGAFDVGLSHFVGTDREPRFIPVVEEQGGAALQPFYAQIRQTGLAVQATVEAWLWKLEVVSKSDNFIGRHTSAAGGLEYTFYSIAGTNGDLGVIAEYQFDDRRAQYAPISQNDAVFGGRWAFNDLDNTQILALFSQDVEYGNRFFSLEASRRLTDSWTLEAELRAFANADVRSPDYSFRNEDYIQLALRRYF